MKLDAKIPQGPLETKWRDYKSKLKLVNPANKRKLDVIVVGTGLAGAAAAASMGELGYNVHAFSFHDSPRRAHSIAAQGGINAAKNYHNDGDSVYRLFYDTVKGGDYRAREGNVYRLAELSVNIIDQAVAQGVPFAREYGGMLDNRSFGGAQVSRTFYAKGQTGQQLLLGAYSALNRQIHEGTVKMYNRHEMLDVVVVNGHAKGVITRNLLTGEVKRHAAHAVVLATGGYGNVYFLSTNAMLSNVTASWRAHKRGAFFANPCYTQIHPTCIPTSGDYQSKLTLMSESLRNDGRVWVPKDKATAERLQRGEITAKEIAESDRDYFLERRYPAFGNLVPRDVASRAAKERCDAGYGVNATGLSVFLDFKASIDRLGEHTIAERYGNLFEMYEKISGENPYQMPMKIYPAVHYTMGGLWVDYNLMSTIPGLYVGGEANFSDHGANRLGASALMQGLADGYFVLPATIGDYLAGVGFDRPSTVGKEFDEAEENVKAQTSAMLATKGKKTVDELHKRLGHLMWEYVGMGRTEAGLKKAIGEIQQVKEDFKKDVNVPGSGDSLNDSLEKAGRVKDFIELGELMARDALNRNESCGGHFREEYQTEDGEAKRDDANFAYVAAWEYKGDNQPQELHKEELKFDVVHPSQRSYK
jgi:succinate dehydrogenase / fumarate reductase flavoprotein subunit